MTASAPPKQTERLQPPKNWETGLLRLTAFSLNPPDLTTIRWWDKLAGAPAEMRNVRVGLGQLIEQGPLDGRILQLQVNLGRVDWLLLPKTAPDSETFESLGDFPECSKYFRELVSTWLAESSPLNRVAFGAQLFIPTSGRQEAMRQIESILPSLRIDWTGIQDFTFQVNRPRACVAWPELGSINRLAKWQVVLRQNVLATLLPQGQAPVSVAQQTAVNLELDMSTAPLADIKKELPREKLNAMVGELIESATEIASKGDVK